MVKTLQLPFSLQHAVMKRLRADLTEANQQLDTNYPEPLIRFKKKILLLALHHYIVGKFS